MTVEVAGDRLNPLRVALAELKRGADLSVSKKASLVVTQVVQQALRLVWKASGGVEAFACSGAFCEGQVQVVDN